MTSSVISCWRVNYDCEVWLRRGLDSAFISERMNIFPLAPLCSWRICSRLGSHICSWLNTLISAWFYSDHCFKDVQLGFGEIKLSCNWHVTELWRWWQRKCFKFLNGANPAVAFCSWHGSAPPPEPSSDCTKKQLRVKYQKRLFQTHKMRHSAEIVALSCSSWSPFRTQTDATWTRTAFSLLCLSLAQHLPSGNTISYRSALSFLQINNRLVDAPRKLDQSSLTFLLECSCPL